MLQTFSISVGDSSLTCQIHRFLKSILIQLLICVLLSQNSIAFVTKGADGFFRCPLGPITDRYPDESDKSCVHYFLCHRGHAFPRMCPHQQAFHPQRKECMDRGRVPETICEQEINCGFNGYYADPRDCSKYYLCFFRFPTHYSCPEGKYYDPDKHQCVHNKEKAKECSKPKPLPHFAGMKKLT